MKVLVTGGTGFLGSYILRELVRKDKTQITAIKRSTSKMDLVEDIKHHINWKECDLSDYDQLETLVVTHDAIIHTAGMVSMSSQDRKQVYATNVDATTQLVNLALANNIKRFVHISSVTTLGYSKEIITEADSWKDENQTKPIYTTSKYLGELEAWRGAAEGLNLTILNPSFIIGGGYWNSGPLEMISRIDNGLKFYPLGSGGVVDVRDVAKITNLVLHRTDLSQKRMICNNKNLSHIDLMKLICNIMQRKYPHIPLGKVVGGLAWRSQSLLSFFTKASTLFTKEGYDISAASFSYDNSYSITTLNIDYIPIVQSIEDMVTCYLQSKKENLTFGILD